MNEAADFVVTIPIECKASLKTKETHLTGLKLYMKQYQLPLGILVNFSPHEIRRYDFGQIVSLPAYGIETLKHLAHSILPA